eukprot:8515664-Pyramimonas_sp.AAC.1
MDKDAGTLSIDWEVLARVVVDPSAPAKVQWNLGALSDLRLARADMDRLAKGLFLPKNIEWSG